MSSSVGCSARSSITVFALATPRKLAHGNAGLGNTQIGIGGFVYPRPRPCSSVVERRSAEPKAASSILARANTASGAGPQALTPIEFPAADRRVYRSLSGDELREARRLESFRRAFAFSGPEFLQRTATSPLHSRIHRLWNSRRTSRSERPDSSTRRPPTLRTYVLYCLQITHQATPSRGFSTPLQVVRGRS
jgi:hypothetical protein